MSIKAVKSRKSLAPDNEPYWESLGHGMTIGYRKHKDGHGVWVAKLVRAKVRRVTTLGALAHIPEAEQYHAAVKLANDWFLNNRSGSSAAVTVGAACRLYIEKRDSMEDVSRCRTLIAGDPIESVSLYRLTEKDVEDWKVRHEQGKRTSTANRQRTFLRAALNSARAAKLVGSDSAWKQPLKAATAASGEVTRRLECLSRSECKALVDACEGQFRDFCRVLCILPLRPGALAHAQARDYDARVGTLFIRKDKEHAGRTVPVPGSLKDIFMEHKAGKAAGELLFTNDSKPWASQAWRYTVKAAAKAAGLPDDTVIYTLRHSIITELCISGMDLMTLAKIAGTSLDMIEKHYGHLRQDSAVAIMDSAAI